jgi:hypothetical protein
MIIFHHEFEWREVSKILAIYIFLGEEDGLKNFIINWYFYKNNLKNYKFTYETIHRLIFK